MGHKGQPQGGAVSVRVIRNLRGRVEVVLWRRDGRAFWAEGTDHARAGGCGGVCCHQQTAGG